MARTTTKKSNRLHTRPVLFILALFQLALLPANALQTISVAWAPSPDPCVAGYNVYYGRISRSYTNKISVGNITNCSVGGMIEGSTYFFAATAFTSDGLESEPSNELSYTVPINVTNRTPTLDPIANIVVDENSG